MRRFDAKAVWSLSGESAPKPFPKDYPTRILVVMDVWPRGSKRRNKWQYLGKPTQALAVYVDKIIHDPKMRGHVTMVEFDRGTRIAQRGVDMSFRREMRSVVPSPLWGYYHPWQDHNLLWALEPFYTKKIKYNDKIIRVYSPFERLNTEHLEGHRRWLDENRTRLFMI